MGNIRIMFANCNNYSPCGPLEMLESGRVAMVTMVAILRFSNVDFEFDTKHHVKVKNTVLCSETRLI